MSSDPQWSRQPPALPAPPIALSSPLLSHWAQDHPSIRPHLQSALPPTPRRPPALTSFTPPSFHPSLHVFFIFPFLKKRVRQTPASQIPPTPFSFSPGACSRRERKRAPDRIDGLPPPLPSPPLFPPRSCHRFPLQKAGGRGCARPAALTPFALCWPSWAGPLLPLSQVRVDT